MFKTLVVALDLEADGDRALRVVQALARLGPVRVDLVTVSSPGMPTAADAYELERRARRFGWNPDAWTHRPRHRRGRPGSSSTPPASRTPCS